MSVVVGASDWCKQLSDQQSSISTSNTVKITNNETAPQVLPRNLARLPRFKVAPAHYSSRLPEKFLKRPNKYPRFMFTKAAPAAEQRNATVATRSLSPPCPETQFAKHVHSARVVRKTFSFFRKEKRKETK